mgnify:CR=1 FL=1
MTVCPGTMVEMPSSTVMTRSGVASSGSSNSFSIQAENRFSVARFQLACSGQTLPAVALYVKAPAEVAYERYVSREQRAGRKLPAGNLRSRFDKGYEMCEDLKRACLRAGRSDIAGAAGDEELHKRLLETTRVTHPLRGKFSRVFGVCGGKAHRTPQKRGNFPAGA